MNGFVDLDEDTLLEVFKRVDVKTLLRAACVNKLWYTTAQNEQLWAPICLRLLAGMGRNWEIDYLMPFFAVPGFSKMYSLHLTPFSKPPPTDFYSIDPEVFSKQIRPWVSPYRGSNELWYTTAQNEQLWAPICSRLLAGMGVNREIDYLMPFFAVPGFSKMYSLHLTPFSKPPPTDFYSIDPEVFSKQIRPWVSPYRGSNELWYTTTAQNELLWAPICSRLLAGMGVNREIDFLMPFSVVPGFSFSEPPTNGFLFDRSGGILEADKTLGFHTEDTTSSRG